jgi:hypothetical protein
LPPAADSEILGHPSSELELKDVIVREFGTSVRFCGSNGGGTRTLAPRLILMIALAALRHGTEAAQGQIINQVEDFAGVAGAQAVQTIIESAAPPAAVPSPPASAPSRSCSGSGMSSASCSTR